jgi:hypothetical protein
MLCKLDHTTLPRSGIAQTGCEPTRRQRNAAAAGITVVMAVDPPHKCDGPEYCAAVVRAAILRTCSGALPLLSVTPPGFIEPCLPTLGHTVPSGQQWVHEIKHDGFRLICRRDGDRVRVFSRRATTNWGATTWLRSHRN